MQDVMSFPVYQFLLQFGICSQSFLFLANPGNKKPCAIMA